MDSSSSSGSSSSEEAESLAAAKLEGRRPGSARAAVVRAAEERGAAEAEGRAAAAAQMAVEHAVREAHEACRREHERNMAAMSQKHAAALERMRAELQALEERAEETGAALGAATKRAASLDELRAYLKAAPTAKWARRGAWTGGDHHARAVSAEDLAAMGSELFEAAVGNALAFHDADRDGTISEAELARSLRRYHASLTRYADERGPKRRPPKPKVEEASCTENGPWPCAEDGCPSASIGCGMLAEDEMGALRVGEVWDAPPAGLADVPVWRECGRACGRCRDGAA